jgi:hypothetical protein
MILKVSAIVGVALACSRVVSAQELDADQNQVPTSLKAASASELSPLLLGASLVSDRALAVGSGGYDTARRGGLFDSAAEVSIWGPLALRVGVTYSDDTRRMRPSVGGRLQLLRQAAHGIDSSLSSFFKTEGFNETEGEIETTVAIGRRFDRYYLLGNVSYGQDPDGRERDGELRLSVLRHTGRAVLGMEARGRSAIGPQRGPNSAVEPTLDTLGGPIAMVSVGSLVLFGEVGPSAVKFQGTSVHWGVASLGGVGSVF